MKFGTPELEVLDKLDLSLPSDHPENKIYLSGKNINGEIFIGCSVWGDDSWVGNVFPEKTKKSDYLSEYIKRFNCVELNSTFYNIKKANMLSWAEKAKETDFKFCPKFNRRISHIKRLKEEVFELADYFVEMCLKFESNLGITLLQMPENFGPKWFDRLKDFIAHLPKDFPVAVELRNHDWYEGEVYDETFQMLREYNKTAVITDTALKREIIHQRMTNKKMFIRFAGYENHPTNFTRINEWAYRLKIWIEIGIEEIYFFSKHEDESFSPATADYMIKKVNELVGSSIKSPFESISG